MPAKKRRRYTQYSQADTYRALHAQQAHVGVGIVEGSVHGNRLQLATTAYGDLQAVVLARSSDWYRYSLNAMTWQHGLQAAVVGTHDSCLPVRVMAMDSLVWYQPYEIRFAIAPSETPDSDPFERRRKTHYGRNVLLGAFICGRPDAVERVMTLPERTRLRYEAQKRQMLKRRRGRPFKV
ncbi:MAG: hypothetical protein JO202_02320 [Ktedonobacteraceae bacterium]|nr:hypothetical protein [Ktedonobacteraceae bacterium]